MVGFLRYALPSNVPAKEGKMLEEIMNQWITEATQPIMILTTIIVAAVFLFGLYLAKTGKG